MLTCSFSTIPHLFRKKPRIIETFPHNLSLRNKAAKRNGKGEIYDGKQEQQPDQRSPGPGGYGQVQDAGSPGR